METGATVEYSTDGGTTWGGTFNAAEGANSVKVRETDVAGNTSVNPTAFAFTYDSSAPAAPGVALASDTGSSGTDNITSNGALALTGVESGATVEYSTDGGAIWSGSFSAAEGTNTVKVRQTDVAGNISTTSSLTFTLDSAAPSVSIALQSDTGPSSTDNVTSNPTVAGGGDANATVHFNVDGSDIAPTATADALGAWSYRPMGLADGAHTIIASETDTAGNTNTASISFTIDTAAPAAPTIALAHDNGVSSTDGITNDPTVSGSTDHAGATVNFVIDGSPIGGFTVTDVSGNWSYTPSGLSDGPHTIEAAATDLGGNTGPSASVTFNLDTAAPATPGLSLVADTGASNTDMITSVGALATSGVEGGAVVEYSTDSGATWWGGFKPAEGVNNVMVRQTDTAGNVSAPSTIFTYTFDATAPVTPDVALANDTGASSTDKITSDGSLSLTGIEASAIVEYSTDGGTTWGTSFTAVEGANSVQVRQTDVAGNVSGASTALSFELDADAPVVTVALANDTGPSKTDKITADPALSGTGDAGDAGLLVHFKVDGSTIADTATVDSFGAWSYTPVGLSEGSHTIEAIETDPAGNTGSASITFSLDTVAPGAPTVALTQDTGSSGSDKITSNPALSGSGDHPFATVDITVNSIAGVHGTVTADASGNWSWTPPAISDGDHTAYAYETDVAGNSGPTTTFAFTLDTTAPATPGLGLAHDTGASASDHITSDGSLSLTDLETGATTQYSTDGGTTWTGTFSAAEGANSVRVRQVDVAGNASAPSGPLAFTLDTSIATPAIKAFSASGATPAISGTAEANSTVSVFDNAGLIGSVTANGSGAWSLSGPALTNGAHDFTATALDAAGNASAEAKHLVVTDAAGKLTVAGGGPSVTLTGGASTDTLDYSGATGAVYIHLTDTTVLNSAGAANYASPASVTVAATDRVFSFENAIGTAYGDRFYGTSGDNVFRPGGGNDIVYGLGGSDTVDYSDQAGGVYVNLAGSAYKTTGGASWTAANATIANTDMLVGISNAYGTAYNDRFYGTSGDNTFRTGGGNDIAYGNGGSDTVDYSDQAGGVYVNLTANYAYKTSGGASWTAANATIQNIDTIVGMSNVYGSAYNDRLYGTSGDNTFRTGAGSDIVYATGATVTLHSGAGSDAGSIFGASGSGFAYSTDTGKLWFDADWSNAGNAVQLANLNGTPVLQASDFKVL